MSFSSLFYGFQAIQMGGPGSGGFRGKGWPPGSQGGYVSNGRVNAVKQNRKKVGAKAAVKYRKERGEEATERDFALQMARRYSKRAPTKISAPKGWKKFKAEIFLGRKAKENEILALHHTLPLWLRCKVLERTSCAKSLVVVEIKEKLSCDAVNRRVSGPRPKLRNVMAFPESALWMK